MVDVHCADVPSCNAPSFTPAVPLCFPLRFPCLFISCIAGIIGKVQVRTQQGLSLAPLGVL